MANCIKCTSELPRNKLSCTVCGAWTWSNSDPKEKGAVQLNAANNFGSITLDQVVSADVDRIHTGPWDMCFGRAELDDGSLGDAGIVRGSTNLIGGSPGAGKSTLFLQMSVNTLLKAPANEEILYISGEEQLPQISARAKRLRIPPDLLKRVRMVDVRKGGAEVSAILQHFKFCLLFLDSLKAIAGDDNAVQIEVCKVVKEYCTFQHAPGILSHHVTKDEAIAGLMGLQHEVDSTHTFFPDAERIVRTEKDPETIRAEEKLVKLGKMTGPVIPYVDEAVRVLEVQKNRNGPAFTQCELLMTSRGLVPYEDPEDDEETEEEE
jgi:DNA repair protein RadA/Sms